MDGRVPRPTENEQANWVERKMGEQNGLAYVCCVYIVLVITHVYGIFTHI